MHGHLVGVGVGVGTFEGGSEVVAVFGQIVDVVVGRDDQGANVSRQVVGVVLDWVDRVVRVVLDRVNQVVGAVLD